MEITCTQWSGCEEKAWGASIRTNCGTARRRLHTARVRQADERLALYDHARSCIRD